MEILIFLVFAFVFLWLIGGAFSLLHAIIKPVVSWLDPEPPAMDPELFMLLQDAEKPRKRNRKRKKKQFAPELRGHRVEPDGMRAVLRLLEEQKAKDDAKPPPLP